MSGAIFRRPYALLAVVSLVVLVLDQGIKALILAHVGPADVISVVPGFFDIVHVRNRGAAFGFLNDPDMDWQFWLFLGATLAAVVAIGFMARQARRQPLLLVALGLILGGAVGNLLDRLRWRSVVDFLDFYIGAWHWPAFNVADMGICVGVFLACLVTWRQREDA